MIERAVSGRLVLDLKQTEIQPDEVELLLHPQTAGVIYFSRNYVSPSQLAELTCAVRDLRSDLLICVDQEGGRVQRFRDGFHSLPPMGSLRILLGDQPDQAALQQVSALGWLMAVELLQYGIDLSFAPVLDLDEARSQVIGDRSFADNPELASALAGAWIDGMHQAGMAATGKHFPGHGGAAADSHLELPVDSRSLEQLEQHDLVPFRKLADKLDAVMMAHLLYEQIDSNPAGYSSFWIGEVLRKQLGYRGVVFSDDLTMEGASGAGAIERRAELSLQAGCDLLLVCNQPEQARRVLNWLDQQPVESCAAPASLRADRAWTAGQIQKDARYHVALDLIARCHSALQ